MDKRQVEKDITVLYEDSSTRWKRSTISCCAHHINTNTIEYKIQNIVDLMDYGLI